MICIEFIMGCMPPWITLEHLPYFFFHKNIVVVLMIIHVRCTLRLYTLVNVYVDLVVFTRIAGAS